MVAVQDLPVPAVTSAPECTADEARELTDRIKSHGEAIWDLICQAYETRAWAALGYESWDAYAGGEFGTVRISLPREQRRDVVASLRDRGLSTRAIGSVTGVSHTQVRKDLGSGGNPSRDEPAGSEPDASQGFPPAEESSGSGDSAPGGSRPETAGQDGDGRDIATPYPSPAPNPAPRVTGTDGKSYPARGDEALLKAAGEKIAEAKPELVERHVYREASKAIRAAWKVLREIDPAVAAAGCRSSIGGADFQDRPRQMAEWLDTFNRELRGGAPSLRVVRGER